MLSTIVKKKILYQPVIDSFENESGQIGTMLGPPISESLTKDLNGFDLPDAQTA